MCLIVSITVILIYKVVRVQRVQMGKSQKVKEINHSETGGRGVVVPWRPGGKRLINNYLRFLTNDVSDVCIVANGTKVTLWQVPALYQQHHRAPSLPFAREYQVCLQTRLSEDGGHSTLFKMRRSANCELGTEMLTLFNLLE